MEGCEVTTSLDLEYQRLAELLARQHVSEIGLEHNYEQCFLGSPRNQEPARF